jgi:hypothetical protein
MKMNDMTVGAGLFYASSNRKPDTAPGLTTKSQDASGLYLSAASNGGNGGWDAQLALGLSNNAKASTNGAADDTLKGKTTFKLSGGYEMDSLYVYANYSQGGATNAPAGGTYNMDRTDTGYQLGVIDSHKKDGTEFFYGGSYADATYKDDAASATTAKTEVSSLPLIMGLESDVMSWLTLRGSITQNVILGSTKATTPAGVVGVNNGNASNTVVAAGTGLHFGKMTFDATLASASNATGVFGTDGANFMAMSSFTYLF